MTAVDDDAAAKDAGVAPEALDVPESPGAAGEHSGDGPAKSSSDKTQPIALDDEFAVGEQFFASRQDAEWYATAACFRMRTPSLVGAQLEWLTAKADGERADLTSIGRALGRYSPPEIAPRLKARRLKAGSAVMVGQGGQVGLSSAPARSVRALCEALAADRQQLVQLLAREGVWLLDDAADGGREPRQLLKTPERRAVAEQFELIDPFAALLQRSTAGLTVCVDAGADAEAVAHRWALVHAAGPALTAAFACSPALRGGPEGHWASQRARLFFEAEHTRTVAAANYVRTAMQAPLRAVRTSSDAVKGETWLPVADASFADWLEGLLDVGRLPAPSDLDHHLANLFSPVRARGHIEIRYIDAQPGDLWATPIAAFSALLSGPAVMAEATRAARKTAGRWRDAAEYGLRSLEMRGVAASLLWLAAENAPDTVSEALLDTAAGRCIKGIAPGALRAEPVAAS